MLQINRPLKITLIIAASVIGLALIGAYPAYLVGGLVCHRHFDRWGKKLVDLEKRGLLSKSYGAGWQDVLTDQAMMNAASRITERDSTGSNATGSGNVQKVDGIVLADYPSLSIINRLREVRTYSNTIEIVDRRDRLIASIRTDHRRAQYSEFSPVLIGALLAAEDKNFLTNNHGFEYGSFVRALLRAVYESATSLKKSSPRGTSTITQQVAKLFISRLDEQGFRRVNKSVDRKVRELRIAAALRKMFTPQDILEVYCNHCVTSDYGMIGYADIASGLFDKNLQDLDDAQCVYLSRMVKWGRNISTKIIHQCHVDMPRIGAALGWDAAKQAAVLAAIDTIQFQKPRRFQGGHSSLVDLANEFWLQTLRKNGSPATQVEQMNLIDPNSLIRKKGNLRIRLTIDALLQKKLEYLVDTRGFGPDTTIIDEVRIGSSGEELVLTKVPRDTMRILHILRGPIDFNEPGSAFLTSLNAGDSVLTNIRYAKLAHQRYRRSLFHYVRRPAIVDGQYFAYVMIDSRTGKLLAYYSKDRIGSRLACLLKNRTPNGSSVVKPICNALNFDLGNFQPNMRWSDTVLVENDVPWKRTFDYEKDKRTGVLFAHSAVRGVGYAVHNHNDVFEGCNYIFDLLNSSNNILGTETVYRLNRTLFTPEGEITPEAFPVVQLFSRIGAFSRVKDSLHLTSVTGVRVYKEIARIAGVDIDSLISFGKKTSLSDSMYSVALGALEMTLYEQLHLFNVLYNNDIIERPADHPSLAIEAITLNGDTVNLADTIRRFHPFSDLNSLRTTWLGLHLRLCGNPADGLTDYDIVQPFDSLSGTPVPPQPGLPFSPDAYPVDGPMSNIAKSGTTDDVIRPFNVDAASSLRTNYGVWNAVIRLDLAKFTRDTLQEITDVTIACIGECNEKFTGARDGKTLHKFLSLGLLKEAGVKGSNGYFTHYEQYLRSVPPDETLCGADGDDDMPTESATTDTGNIAPTGHSEEPGW